MTFTRWMTKVDNIVWDLVGVSVYDLPDCCYHDWYDNGINPAEAAGRVMEENML